MYSLGIIFHSALCDKKIEISDVCALIKSLTTKKKKIIKTIKFDLHKN